MKLGNWKSKPGQRISIRRLALPGLPKTTKNLVFPYICKGGPLNDALVYLSEGTTAVLRIGTQTGRYECRVDARRNARGRTGAGETHWCARERSV